jgi:hypothetical protein
MVIALGIEAVTPQRSEEYERKARPKGERPKVLKHALIWPRVKFALPIKAFFIVIKPLLLHVYALQQKRNLKIISY